LRYIIIALSKKKGKTFVTEDNRYVYYNRRPDGKHLQDCVCRAISTATGLNYQAVEKLLNITSEMYGCEKLCVNCYHNLLEALLSYPCIVCKNNETVEDIAKKYPSNKIIIRVQGHLTCSVDGAILDIWDCSNEIVDCYWIVH